MVNAEGYRKSASKPKLVDIPPNSRLPMATLIELTDVPSHYTYELIVNEKEMAIAIEHDKATIDIENTITGKLVIFSEEGCDKCDLLDTMLTSERVQFRNLDIREDPELYKQFIAFIHKKFPSKTEIRLPVIWNKDHVIFGYDDIQAVLKNLID
jgi:glutaredoxin